METREVIPFPQPIRLSLCLPGSKSITNRALLCAALSRGRSQIIGAGEGDDSRVMLSALKKLGVRLTQKSSVVEVVGAEGRLRRGTLMLDCHNAGTATRFLAALSVLREGPTIITGDARMRERPIADLVDGLRQLGAEVKYLKNEGCPPIRIQYSGLRIKPQREYGVRVKGDQSSQYLSALLMVGPMLGRPLRIRVAGRLTSQPYVDMTLAVMRAFGVRVQNKGYREFLIRPQSYKACRYRVEGDATAGTYCSSINYLHGGTLSFQNLGLQSIQGDVDYPRALAQLGHNKTIDMGSMPDAAMTLAVTAPFTKSKTTLTGLGNLRIKETDRLKALETELQKVGIRAKVRLDSLVIEPVVQSRPAVIQTYNDHRMAMSFAVLGTSVSGIVIENPGCAAKSYPGFWEDLELAYLAPIKLGRRHLVLTGMRGAGKTYLGKKIARLLKRPFIDIDSEIERDQGMNIMEMVKRHGWGYFRKVEQKICSSFGSSRKAGLAQDDKLFVPLVIATGGGVVLNPENMSHLQHNAINVFIFADPTILAERVMQGQERPPLKVGQKPEEEIRHLWEERRPLYLKYADVVWDNTSGKVIEKYLKSGHI